MHVLRLNNSQEYIGMSFENLSPKILHTYTFPSHEVVVLKLVSTHSLVDLGNFHMIAWYMGTLDYVLLSSA